MASKPAVLPACSRLIATTLLAWATSSFGPAFGEPTLKELLEEARGGHTVLVKEVDASGRILEMGGGLLVPPRDEMNALERLQIMNMIEENRSRLVAEGKLSRDYAKTITNFSWPLRQAAGRGDFDYHAISAFVDQNLAFPNQLLDYNCGARTYDVATGNHQGTDIYVTPFPWNKMDAEDVVIVAGAPGTIVGKTDGNYDRNCAMSNASWNAVYVQHADGSVAWYGHMKNGSTTVKGVGETVVAGEYLGAVGSSGSSTGPHLHLQIFDAANALVDPFLGPCNSRSTQVTWAQQRPYRDTGVNALTVGMAAPVFPSCPTPATSNATDFVTPGTTAYFTTYLRDQTTATPISIRILRPDGSVFASRTGGSGDYNSSYWFFSFGNFSNVPGTWTFEASIAGKSYAKTFQVGGSVAFGSPATIVALAGSAQVAAPGSFFASPLRVQVLDAQGRPVVGAKVSFTTPAAGATAVLESKTALTDASGIASVTAIANAKSGAYAVSAAVAGAAVPASITLQNAAVVAGGVSRTPSSVDFGSQSLRTTSPSQAVTLTNNGGTFLSLATVVASANFNVTHNCTTLAPGASCVANAAFTPAAEGWLNGSLTIQSDAGTQAVALTGAGERSLVTHYYRAILRRAPDAGGKSYWNSEATRVQALGVNVNEVWFAMAGSFFTSPEYLALNRDNAGFVTDLYTTFFNRAPDAAGLAYWKGQLDQGLPREVALAGFMFSTEFGSFTQAIFGTANTRKEVDTVVDFYRGLLGSLPDDGGFRYWLGLFRAAQCQGGAAVNAQVESISSAFANSAQYVNRGRSNPQYVGDLYNAFLRRGGDLGGVQFWINEVASGARTRENVRQQFVGSPEFQARVAAIIAQGCLP